MKKIINIVGFVLLLNICVTTNIDRFSHPELTQTQLLLRLPHVFFWNFKTIKQTNAKN